VEAFVAHCAPDVVVFDMIPPPEQKGVDALRKAWAATLGAFEGPIEYEASHLDVHVSGDVAFSRHLIHFGGTTKDGKIVMNRLRSTLGFRKIAGTWKIVHEHLSVPFDANGQAMMTLDG
jgi:ketosteroid isomerase-like protein